MTSSSHSVKYLSPEEIASRKVGEAATIRMPEAAFVFRDRGLRLRQLAAGHAMRDFLIFMAQVAEGQHAVLQTSTKLTLPSEEFLGQCAREGIAPLQFPRWTLHDEWQQDLSALLEHIKAQGAGQAGQVIERLQQMDAAALNHQAERLLSGIMLGLDLATAPLIGAALQLHWTRLTLQTQNQFADLAFGLVDNTRLCPCCGSKPTSSLVRMGGDADGLRYLHCSLCQAQWQMVRIKCTQCESVRDITYQELEAQEGAQLATYFHPPRSVRAECCADCHHYLKIMDMNNDAHVDPVADDLASVSLDLLVSESGSIRHGLNLMLLWGEPAEETEAGSS